MGLLLRYARLSCIAAAALCAGLLSGCAVPPPVIDDVTLEPNPSGRVPLSAVCRFKTDKPARAEVLLSDGEETTTIASGADYVTEHEIAVLGFRPGREYTVRVRAVGERGGEAVSLPMEIAMDPLPAEFPPVDLKVSRPRRMEPGITLLPIVKWPGLGQPERSFGLILGVDDHAEVVWYYQADHNIVAVERLRNGNLLYHYGRRGNIVEIDMLGNVINEWYARRMHKGPRETGIPIDTDTIHHDVQEMPSGDFLALSTEVRHFESYPSSETDPDAEWEPAFVIGDVLLQVTREGEVLNRWPLLDILDCYRLGYDSLDTGFWSDVYNEQNLGGVGYDWSHANSVAYDARDHSAILSVYHQDAVFKLDLDSGELVWVISFPSGWREEWDKYLLYPVGDGMYPCHEHAAKVTPQGTILMFDNGTYRARPFDLKRHPKDNFSRAVEYEIDEEKMEFKQVWSYGGPEDEIFFSPFLGDTDWLPITGNVMITDGARVRAPDGSNANHPAHGRKWAHILEVTHDQPAQKVFEIVIDDPGSGWTVYRAERIPGLYP